MYSIKEVENKWVDTGVNVWDRTVINRLNEIEFMNRKDKRKPALTHKHNKMRLKWAKEKQS